MKPEVPHEGPPKSLPELRPPVITPTEVNARFASVEPQAGHGTSGPEEYSDMDILTSNGCPHEPHL